MNNVNYKDVNLFFPKYFAKIRYYSELGIPF